MLEFTKTYQDRGRAEYSYLVEGNRGDVGTVAIDLPAGEAYVKEAAPGDPGLWYANKLMDRLEGMAKAKSMDEGGTLLWY